MPRFVPSEFESTSGGASGLPSKWWKIRTPPASAKGISSRLPAPAPLRQHPIDECHGLPEIVTRLEDGGEIAGGEMLAHGGILPEHVLELHPRLAGAAARLLDQLVRPRPADARGQRHRG